MWRFAAQSVRGAHHDAEGSPCQDASLVRVFGSDDQCALMACACDGAGSAAHSDQGAQLTCRSIVECAAEYYESAGSFDDLAAETALKWCEAARQAIAEHAESAGRLIRDYACTLCLAVVSNARSVFIQIGDGAIVACRNDACGVVFWPQSGEYINTTNFLTSNDYREQLQTCEANGGFSDVAVLTDGIERLALRFDALMPHLPFFKPLFAALRGATDVEALTRDLGRFLESDSIKHKTDDDKTLILASWLPAGG
jgi:serine/threonine protein phosphatase PrpC